MNFKILEHRLFYHIVEVDPVVHEVEFIQRLLLRRVFGQFFLRDQPAGESESSSLLATCEV